MCDSMRGSLIKKQINFCKRNPTFMDSVRLGAARAIDECQFQFRSRRWNCSTLEDKINKDVDILKSHLGNIANMGNMGDMGNMGHLGNMDPDNDRRGGGGGQKFNTKSMNLPYKSSHAFGSSANGGGVHAPDPYDTMYNSMYNAYNGNRQQQAMMHQSYNKNVRRGRRISRKARHGTNSFNGSRDNPNDKEDEEVTNDTSMVSNGNRDPVASGPPPSVATPSGGPPTWALNSTIISPQPPAPTKQSSRKKGRKNNERGRRKNNNNNNNNKNKKRKNDKKKAKDVVPLGPYPVVSPGTRESAFVHAISSAGVAHALTRACSSGELENCGCDRSLRGISPEGFQWSGCSDNVDFGITFSRNFVDARDRRKSRKNPRKAQPLMNLHNNEAGRKLLERNMKVECKCHGVSGSCELKTCWRSVASFRMIGEILKEKFDSAHEVQQKKRRGRRRLLPRFQRFKPHTDTDLVYLKTSPNYCEFDIRKGSLGTHGRECDPRSPGIDGCELMCCNRGYKTRRERRKERCKCKFHWCCFVQCEECYREVEVSTCN